LELDDLKDLWCAHHAALERSLAIEERLLKEVLLRKVRIALAPSVIYRCLEVAAGLAALVAFVRVLATHLAEPRYVVVAGGLVAFTLAMTVACAALLVRILTLDYSAPVATTQRAVERLKVAEVRTLKWALLGGTVIWLPLALVLFESLTGVGLLARVDAAWLAGNLLVGLALLGFGQVLSRRYVERKGAGTPAHWLVEALSSRPVRSASAHLKELAAFEREEPPEAVA